MSFSADDFAAGDTVAYIPNKGIEGVFEAQDAPAIVKEVEGKKAFSFEGKQVFRSSFSENECIADFTSSHDELEKIMLVNGTEPRCGMLNHYGWYEDVGYKDAAALAGKWQHIYVEFDGRTEKVYINDRLISSKDIQILVKPIQFVTCTKGNGGTWVSYRPRSVHFCKNYRFILGTTAESKP